MLYRVYFVDTVEIKSHEMNDKLKSYKNKKNMKYNDNLRTCSSSSTSSILHPQSSLIKR